MNNPLLTLLKLLAVFCFTLALNGLAQPTNDAFANPHILKGGSPPTGPVSLTSATEELGEPVHIAGTPTKSVWWSWQAPNHGTIYVSWNGGSITSAVITVFKGDTIASLNQVAKGTNDARFPIWGGEKIRISAAVPTNVVGEVELLVGYESGVSLRIVPGNLLKEPSWEGTRLNPQFWQTSGSIGGHIGGAFGADGTTWPDLGTDAAIWQDIPTIPGHQYQIQFAYGISGCCGNVGIRTFWNSNDLGIIYNWVEDSGYWHWADFVVTASNTTSRVLFYNVHQAAQMDAFSVVDLTTPPTLVRQPSPVSTFEGGSAAFIVGANGSAPLRYQWRHGGTPLPGATNHTLFLNAVTPSQAGSYTVVITNNFGSITSSPAALIVETDTNAAIVVQPFGDTLPAGSYFNLNVTARGAPPLTYQWFKDNTPVPSGTNRNLIFSNLQLPDAGSYDVLVQSAAGQVRSLAANLVVTTTNQGGGLIVFWNKFPFGETNIAHVFDIDGATPLSGTDFAAQLYAGPTPELLRAVGNPSSFLTVGDAGIFQEQVLALPNVPPGGAALTQVRAWERSHGSSYEEARAAGGRFGRSAVVEVLLNTAPETPQRMIGLQPFQLQTGLPLFSTGIIELQERQPGGTIIWSLRGEPGFRYLVEKSNRTITPAWLPFIVLTNVTGSVTFSDSASSGSAVVLYRARILD